MEQEQHASIHCSNNNGWDLCALFTWGLMRLLQLFFYNFSCSYAYHVLWKVVLFCIRPCKPSTTVAYKQKRMNLGTKINTQGRFYFLCCNFRACSWKICISRNERSLYQSIRMVNLVSKRGLTRLGILLIYPGVECHNKMDTTSEYFSLLARCSTSP